MFGRGQKQLVAQGLTAAELERRRQRQHVGFGRAGGKSDVFGLGADQRGHILPCGFNDLAGGAAFGMDRRGVARQAERSHHRLAGLRPQRRCRIPVKVSPFNHLAGQYLATVIDWTVAKSLLFALRVMVETRIRLPISSQLIALVAALNSGIPIIRIILN